VDVGVEVEVEVEVFEVLELIRIVSGETPDTPLLRFALGCFLLSAALG